MRATGKTFRAVLRALADASEGKNVVLVISGGPELYVHQFAEAATKPLHDCVYFNFTLHRVEFRKPPEGREVLGTFRVTDLATFQRDVREDRYRGTDWGKFKVVFDDCTPNEYTRVYLEIHANG